MAAELKNAFDTDPVLTEGSGGIFDVIIDGKIVFSKDDTGRFPKPEELSSK